MPEEFKPNERKGDWDIVKSVTDLLPWGHKERPEPKFDKPLIQPSPSAIEQFRRLHEAPPTPSPNIL
jgi:hypothetical protein